MASKTQTSPTSKLPDPTDIGQVIEEPFERHYPIAKIDVLGSDASLLVGLVNAYGEIEWEEADRITGCTMTRRPGGALVFEGFSPAMAAEMHLSRQDATVSWTWSPVG